MANDSDANGDPLTAELEGFPAEAGALELAPDGSFRYTPAPGYVGVFTFSYAASDGRLRSTATATISVFDPTTPAPEPEPAPGAEDLYRVYLPLLRR